MKKIVQELQHFVKASTYGTASDRALLLDYQATLQFHIVPEIHAMA